MKLKTNTMLLAIAAALIAGGAVYWEVNQSNARQQPAAPQTSADLFDFTEDDVVKLSVSPVQGITLEFQRTTESFPNSWKMTAPNQVVADEAAIAFLLDQLASSHAKSTVTVEQSDWADFGIDPNNPQTTVELDSGTSHTLLLGGETFDKQNHYAIIDPPTPLPEALKVSVVSSTLLNAVQRPLDEWEYDPEALKPQPPGGNSRKQINDTSNNQETQE